MVHSVLVDQEVQKVLEVLQGHSNLPGQQTLRLRRVRKVQPVRRVLKVPKAQLDLEVPNLLTVQKDQKDHLVHSDQKVLMVLVAQVVR